jgi:tetratricopeptide (TPR) repeat protein
MKPVAGHVFIMHHFDENGRSRARQLTDILKLLNISTVFGENFCGQEISAGVRSRIEDSRLVVGLLTRDVEISKNKWQPSQWIVQEITWAVARGIPVLLAVENGVVFNGGLVGELEQIFFKNGDYTSAVHRIAKQAKSMMSGVIVPQELPEESLDARVWVFILKARECGRKRQWKEVLSLSEQALRLDPKVWRAKLNYGLALVMLGHLSRAENVFEEMSRDFADNHQALAATYHNFGWIEEVRSAGSREMKSLRKQSRYYERSLALEASRIYTRASLLLCKALMSEKNQANTLLMASLKYRGFLTALRSEIDNRGWLGHQALRELPEWLYPTLFPTYDPNDDDDENLTFSAETMDKISYV